MKVRDVMKSDPVTVTETTRVARVVDLVYAQGIRHVPVVTNGELVGIISDRDLREIATPALLPNESRPLLEMPARNVMSTHILAVAPDDELTAAIDHIIDGTVGALPVLEAGNRRLLGIISYVDILRALRERASG